MLSCATVVMPLQACLTNSAHFHGSVMQVLRADSHPLPFLNVCWSVHSSNDHKQHDIFFPFSPPQYAAQLGMYTVQRITSKLPKFFTEV